MNVAEKNKQLEVLSISFTEDGTKFSELELEYTLWLKSRGLSTSSKYKTRTDGTAVCSKNYRNQNERTEERRQQKVYIG